MALQDTIWAGSEQSLQAALDADEAKTAKLIAGTYSSESDEDGKSRLLEVSDGVAIISIKGTLNNSDDSWWNEYTGMTGYPEIREALISVAQDASVQHVLLDIDSGGGSVAGVEDTAKLIRAVAGIKPVSAYSDGAMCSAAYWLGSAASNVYVGKSTISGSIGVISTHMERSKMLADAGIGVTVVRSGKFKALANGVEKLSDEGKAQIQKIVDAADSVFVDSVAEMRGKSVDYVRASMGQGKEFIGQEAVDVGIADALTSFDKLLSDIRNSLPSDNSFDQNRNKSGNAFAATSNVNVTGDASMAKKALTEQDIAAIAAGVAAPNVDASTDTVVDVTAPVDAAAPNVEPAAETAPVEPSASDSAVVPNLDALTATVQLLNGQLAAKDDALIQAGVKLAKLEENLAETKALHDPMLALVAASTSNLMVALGGTAMTFEGMSAAAVLKEHDRLSVMFKEKFKVGGVAAVTGDAAAEPAQVDARHMVRVNAARHTK